MAYIGLQLPSFTYPGVPDERLFDSFAGSALAAEAAGFDSVWVMDHFFQIPGVGEAHEPMLEAYSTLAALAVLTSRVELGTLVTGVSYRNAALLAKAVTTLDVISAGRAILGIGASWHEEEHVAYGYRFPPMKERFERLEDALEICTAMFTREKASYEGRHLSVTDALNYPRPVRPGGPRILIGGGGEKKTLRMVARYAHLSNVFGDVPTVRHKLRVLEDHCEDLGRDPAEITTTKYAIAVIAATAAEAEQKVTAEAAKWPWGSDQYRAQVHHGDVAAVAESFAPYFEAGLDGMIVSLPDAYDHDSIHLLAAALREASA